MEPIDPPGRRPGGDGRKVSNKNSTPQDSDRRDRRREEQFMRQPSEGQSSYSTREHRSSHRPGGRSPRAGGGPQESTRRSEARRGRQRIRKGFEVVSSAEASKLAGKGGGVSDFGAASSRRPEEAHVPTIVRHVPPAAIGQRRAKRMAREERLNLSWYKAVPLRDEFPISPLFVVQKSLSFLVITVVAWASYIYFYGIEGIIESYDASQSVFWLVCRTLLGVCLVVILYWEAYRRTIEYAIEGFRLVIRMGIFWKLKGSIALLPVTQVFVKQSAMDLLFDLYTIQLYTPMTPDDSLTRIPGLSRDQAYAMEKRLTDELNRQVFIAPEAREIEQNLQMVEDISRGDV